METKNPYFKTFQTWFNRLSKGTLPIMHKMMVQNNEATMSDLETWLTFPVDLPDGYYDIRMNEAFRTGDIDEYYPRHPLTNAKPKTDAKAVLSPEAILEFAKFIANDELRPTMNAIYVTAEGITSTDAHTMRYNLNIDDVSCLAQKDFDAMIVPTMPLLAICRMKNMKALEAEIFCTKGRKDDEYIPTNIRFKCGDITLTQRLVEGKYPQYKSVIPEWGKLNIAAWQFDAETVTAMSATGKSFIRELTVLRSDFCKISNIDLGLEKEFKVSTVETPSREPDGLFMPMCPGSGSGKKLNPGEIILFNNKLFARFLTHGSKLILGVRYDIDKETKEIKHDPTRPMAIWIETAVIARRNDEATSQSQPQKALPPCHCEERSDEATSPSPAPKAPQPVIARRRNDDEANSPHPQPLQLIDYSEKAVAVFGDTRRMKLTFMNLYGRYNPNLKLGNEKVGGWIFSKKRKPELQSLIAC